MDIKPTIILSKRNQVDEINNREHNLLSLEGVIKYKMQVKRNNIEKLIDEGYTKQMIESEIKSYKKNSITKTNIELRTGDQVMCTRNINTTIVNGSRGIVINPGHEKIGPTVKFMNGQILTIEPYKIEHEKMTGIVFTFIPLIYSWAITIHKCQGSTLDFCVMDIGSDIFTCGQSYVALSRVKELKGLYLTRFNPSKIIANLKVKEFYSH